MSWSGVVVITQILTFFFNLDSEANEQQMTKKIKKNIPDNLLTD